MTYARRLAFFAIASTMVSAALFAGCGDGGTSVDPDGGGKDATPKKDGATLDAPMGFDGAAWPDCTSVPPTAAMTTIADIWAQNYSKPTEVYLSGGLVTGISAGGCTAGFGCQIFIQDAASYGNLAAASKHAIKIFASANTAQYFAGVAVGDKIDVLGWAWRYNLDGYNELLVQVNLALPGCFKKVGTGTATPTSATLDDFTPQAYEQTMGPVFVKLDAVSGTPQQPTEIFALRKTGVFSDAGLSTLTSLSPFFLPGTAFTGLTQGQATNFTSVTGVFSLYLIAPDAGGTKYEVIYPRTMADVVK
jgi:hypothetical protein